MPLSASKNRTPFGWKTLQRFITELVTTVDSMPTTTGYETDITGNGSSTSFNINHNLNTKYICVGVWKDSDGTEAIIEKIRTSVNQIQLIFAVAPANGEIFNVKVGC